MTPDEAPLPAATTHKRGVPPFALFGLWLSLAVLADAPASEFFVAPNGKPTGDGSRAEPWDLETALYQAPGVQPGDTIYLRAGRYVEGHWNADANASVEPGRRWYYGWNSPIILRGARGRFVTVRSAPDEWAVIDGGFQLTEGAAWTTWRDLEITCTIPERTAKKGEEDYGPPRPCAFNLNGPHIRIINNLIHDGAMGVGVWSSAPDAEVYGNIISYVGWNAGDRGHGHGIYFQSKSGPLRIADNVIFDNFGFGIQARSEDKACLNDDTLEGNILFNNGSLIRPMNEAYGFNLWLGPDAPSSGLVVERNVTYFAQPWGRTQIGGESSRGVPRFVDSRLVGNIFADGYEVHLTNCEGTIRDNVFLGKFFWTDGGKARSADDFRRVYPGNTLHQDPRQSGTAVVVRPNRYEPGRACLAIYNWDLKDSAEVDVSGVLSSGDRYELRAVQDLLGDAITGTCRGTTITVPMRRRRVGTPVGWKAPSSTLPEFGAFLLRRVGPGL